MKVKVLVAQSSPTLCDSYAWQAPRLLCLWDFPGKNTGVGCHFLPHWIELMSPALQADSSPEPPGNIYYGQTLF